MAVAVTFLAPPAIEAGPPTDQIREYTDALIRILEDPALKADGHHAERRATVRRLTTEVFDFDEIARRSLGRHWHGCTADQRQEFVALFSDLLERSHIQMIERGKRISYQGDAIDGDAAVVRTKLMTKQDTGIPIDYRMLRRGDKWMVYDI